eukprot:TRINITY_DN14118_c0_g1_i3.p1 TRINITY_DN14118_c0_g1~~TRINITY_DN14118_c0_g1_i3.p1  ORF type:complete len:452 (-),score=116.15 TRINITY_DN14118_c0_g1_i3:68-1423(-)
MPPFECVKRADIGKKMRNNKGKAAKQRKKSLRRQRKLKEKVKGLTMIVQNTQEMVSYYQSHCPGVTPGCKWGEWGEWGSCVEGMRSRRRPKLIGEGNNCEGEETETEEGCVEVESDNWLEGTDNVAYVFGGRLTTEGGEAEAVVLSGSSDCKAPAFPAWRQRMTAAYAPGQGIMACGGLTSGGSPSDECWTFTEGNKVWAQAPSSGTPLSSAVSSWYKGEFWMLGGTSAKEDDKPKLYKQKMVAEAMKFNPGTQTWSVLIDQFLVEPVQGACMVNIEDPEAGETLVLTGGTDKKIQYDKKIAGKKATYMYNDAKPSWQFLPLLKIARASHSCSVATIGGSLGIVVAGGSNDGDSVEFLDWDEKKKWIKIPRMSRQRGIGPGMAFIRGKLSMIGGYTWPEAVNDVEMFDSDEEKWNVDSKSQEKRFNHVALTVPSALLPQCPLLPMIQFDFN